MTCKGCREQIEAGFRFCPWCAEPQRRKLVEFFPGTPQRPEEHGLALRVSRYLGDEPDDRHVRFSVWSEAGVALAAVSLHDREAERLGGFLRGTGERTHYRARSRLRLR